MNDHAILFLFLIIALVLLWFFVWGPQAKEVRAEKKRLEAEERALREAERAKLLSERDDLLQSIRGAAPDFIINARLEFEREYRSKGGEGMFGQEMSPLTCFGYRVGKTKGRPEAERRAILEYAVAADYDRTLQFLPESYRNEWGKPLSLERFNRIYQHLNNTADLRDGRRNYEVAVSHWRTDALWFRTQQLPNVEMFHTL
jgi:cbb3-type cytochrome oxidase subunit 3